GLPDRPRDLRRRSPGGRGGRRLGGGAACRSASVTRARSTQRGRNLPFIVLSCGLVLGGGTSGCVLSTYSPPGTPPDIPEPPRPEPTATSSAPDTGPRTIAARHVLVSFAGARSAAPYITRTREEAF